jgi:hypothetical protein
VEDNARSSAWVDGDSKEEEWDQDVVDAAKSGGYGGRCGLQKERRAAIGVRPTPGRACVQVSSAVARRRPR